MRGFLLLTPLLILGATQGAPTGDEDGYECCSEKIVGGIHYTRVGEDETGKFKKLHCINNCLYVPDGSDRKYCFAPGEETVECEDDAESGPPPTGETEEPEDTEEPPYSEPEGTSEPYSEPEGSGPPPTGETEGPEDTEEPPYSEPEGTSEPYSEPTPEPGDGDGGNGGDGGDGGDDKTAEYCAINSEHTMCKWKGPSAECAEKTILRGLTEEGKANILERHNQLRRRVANGEETGQPPASNMRELVWDPELEAIAQRWVDQCTFGHDSKRNKLDGTYVGQNAFFGSTSWEEDQAGLTDKAGGAAQAWYDEVIDPGFNADSIEPFVFDYGAGHYTQVVWAETTALGCANVYYKDGTWYKNLVVCNYAKGGNMGGATMYLEGPACSACPTGTVCSDSLCKAA